MGQRLSELCSKGPYLEEDIAISNIALDYLGQANMLYELLKKTGGDKHSVDDYVFHRNERNYYNLLMVEQDNGHFGKTMAKIFLYSTYQKILYSHLSKSTNDDIKAIALKSIKEVDYHFKHSRAWVLRLGDGTQESKVKIQDSIYELWRFTGEMFESDDVENNFSTLIYLIDNPKPIHTFQLKLLNKFKPFKGSEFLNLSKEFNNDFKKYNYPFVGENLIPHFTVTNISNLDTSEKISY